jgi:predicted HTH transcriptional regulator
MFPSKTELLEKIRLGEDSYLEVKEVRFSGERVSAPSRNDLADELAAFANSRGGVFVLGFDEQTVPSATLDDLQRPLWERFITPLTLDAPENLIQKLGMARRDEDGVVRPTVAGVLLAAAEPQHFLPNAFIQAVAYRGVTIRPGGNNLYQRDEQDITGPLDEQVFAAVDFIRKNMFVMARKGLGREELPQYDQIAVFEAVANAVAHRDYSMYGAKIRLRLFDDRLELYVPGSIANTMTVDSLPYRQFARNETITSLLARCPVRSKSPEIQAHRTYIMDKRGEGVPLILSRSEGLSGRLPVYRLLDDAELFLTIYAAGGDET